ncbi:MAG TPA: hypothetical protein VGE67_10175 [Haloferula sp.]
MKRIYLPLIALLGFVAGWCLPASDPAPTASSAPLASEGPRRELKKRALFDQLLFDEERETYRARTASIAETVIMLNGMRHGQACGGYDIVADIERMVSQDPVAAMDKVLSDPMAEYAGAVALEWFQRQPEEALRYLRGKKQSYRVEDCLQAIANFHPDAAAEEPAEQASASSEPEKTEEKEDKPQEPPADPEPPAKTDTWDTVDYDPEDFEQREALNNALKEKPDETIARVSSSGNLAARKQAIEALVSDFPYAPEKWPDAMRKLEASIQQLGVVPEDPPIFHSRTDNMDGSQVASWIDRQPLALRRAWASPFVEDWAQADPQAAVAWASSLPEQADSSKAIQTGLIIWTHRDPTAAIAYVDAMPEGDLREISISNAAATWKCIDPAAAKKWVEALPDSPGKQRALERLKE